MSVRVFLYVFTCTAVAVSATGFDAVAAGPGGFRSRLRPTGQPTTRVYRSYSVSPGSDIVPESSVIEPPETVRSMASPNPVRTGGQSKSKSSYMRADSKARGRFHQ